jgi:hypothetical protein
MTPSGKTNTPTPYKYRTEETKNSSQKTKLLTSAQEITTNPQFEQPLRIPAELSLIFKGKVWIWPKEEGYEKVKLWEKNKAIQQTDSTISLSLIARIKSLKKNGEN